MLRTGGTSTVGASCPMISNASSAACSSSDAAAPAEGKLHLCLGQSEHVDLKRALREGGPDALDAVLDEAMRIKPERHDFHIERPAVARHMSVTGG